MSRRKLSKQCPVNFTPLIPAPRLWAGRRWGDNQALTVVRESSPIADAQAARGCVFNYPVVDRHR
jgi:hypothetical protein